MGYATNLYAVDIDVLRSKIGSNDPALIKRFDKAKKKQSASAKLAAKGPRIKVAVDSQIFLNGEPVTFEQLTAALPNPEWAGTDIRIFQEIYDVKEKDRSGPYKKIGSFFQAFGAIIPPSLKAIHCCQSDQDLLGEASEDDDDGDEIPLPRACLELVTGDITWPDCGHQYAYALEKICKVVGKHLATIEGRRGILSHLGLDTRLRDERSPVELPERDDFPAISYLTGEEVQGERAQLAALDLSFPEDRDIEEDRHTFYKAIETAAGKQLGIVAFYY